MKTTKLFLIAGVLAASTPVIRAELVGHWKFDGDLQDSSDKGNHGSFQGGAALGNDIPTTLGSGQSLQLNGSGYVLVEHSESLNLEETLTLTAWIKPVGDVGWDGILAKNPSFDSNPNHAGNFELRIQSGERALQFLSQRGGLNDTATYTSAETVIEADVWSHIAITAEVGSGNLRFFLNGELTETQTDAINFDAFPVNEMPVYIGNRAGLATPFDGFLDDVALFDGVLSESQVPTVMNGDFDGFSAEEPPRPLAFSIAEVTFHPEAKSVTISWESVSGASYTVETSSDLVVWTPLAEGIESDAGNFTSYTDAERAPDAEILFYRIIQH